MEDIRYDSQQVLLLERVELRTSTSRVRAQAVDLPRGSFIFDAFRILQPPTGWTLKYILADLLIHSFCCSIYYLKFTTGDDSYTFSP